jgi:hypothetical protein
MYLCATTLKQKLHKFKQQQQQQFTAEKSKCSQSGDIGLTAGCELRHVFDDIVLQNRLLAILREIKRQFDKRESYRASFGIRNESLCSLSSSLTTSCDDVTCSLLSAMQEQKQ